MIYVTGDTHGDTDISKISGKNWPASRKLNKDDFLIIAGDFGFLWNNEPDNHEIYWLIWLMEKPFSVGFIDGNHECHPRLYKLPVIEKFGGKVGVVREGIYHLKRGEIYNIDGKTLFTMGGAQSIDKENRREFVSWWKEEIPSYAEMDYALNNLEKHGNKVDYVITHTAPYRMIDKLNALRRIQGGPYAQPEPLLAYIEKLKDPTAKFLDEVYNKVSFKKWYCGHFHVNVPYPEDRFDFLYEKIVDVEKGLNISRRYRKGPASGESCQGSQGHNGTTHSKTT